MSCMTVRAITSVYINALLFTYRIISGIHTVNSWYYIPAPEYSIVDIINNILHTSDTEEQSNDVSQGKVISYS